MGNPVMHFEIVSEDAPKLRDFYREVFAWTIDASTPGASLQDYTAVRPGAGAGIEGGIGTAPAGYGGHCTFYIAVDDIEPKLAEIARRGGRCLMPPTPVPGGPTIALFVDPGGFTVGLVQP